MAKSDTPLAELSAAEEKIDPPAPEPMPEPVVEPATDAAGRLRAFEDEVFGADTARIDGKVERGIGSYYQRMSDAERAHHQALEALVAAEQRLADAHAALVAADAAHEAAEERVNATAAK